MSNRDARHSAGIRGTGRLFASLLLAASLALSLMPLSALAEGAPADEDVVTATGDETAADGPAGGEAGDTADVTETTPATATGDEGTGDAGTGDETPTDPTPPQPQPTLTKADVSPKLVTSGYYKGGSGWRAAVKTAVGKANTVTSKSGKADLVYLRAKLTVTAKEAATGFSAGIKYRVRVAGKWTAWSGSYAKVGKGKTKAITALQVKLTGTASKYFDVYYRVKSANVGWLGWASNGASAGVSGKELGARALQIKLVKKGKAISGSTKHACLTAKDAKVTYGVSTTKAAAKASRAMGKTAGKAATSASSVTSLATRVSSTFSGSVKCSLYKKSGGWSAYAANGKAAGKGTQGATAVKVKLTGKVSKYFDVYYRVYVKRYGWMGWAKNGQAAGNTTYSIGVTALQVRLVFKGASAPGSTGNCFSTASGVLQDIGVTKKLSAKAQKLSSNTKYLILTSTSYNRVAIFEGSKGNWTMIRYYQCTSGASSSPTKKGTFTVSGKGLHFGEEKGYTCWYYTQFYGDYLFHSVLYYPGSKTSVMDGRLGINASHGCVRLALANAKWIYDNIPYGTKVVVF